MVMIRWSQSVSRIDKHAGGAVSLLLCLLASPLQSHAGPDIQGTNIQGTNIQGTNIQGTNIQGTNIQGTNIQGTNIQGTNIQGTNIQGTELREQLVGDAEEFTPVGTNHWLQGERLVGMKTDAAGTELAFLEVLHFAGEQVHALSWTAAAGWQRAVLSPRDLVGFRWLEYRCHTLDTCTRHAYRIVDAQRDTSRNTMPEHGDNSDVWLYQVEHAVASQDRADATDGWKPVCTEAEGASAHGLFVSGRWERGGAFQSGGYTFSCTSGVIAKCVRSWGYKPWKRLYAASGSAVSLRPLHEACVRAARADYCGTGTSHTRSGTMVDLFDIYGFNVRSHTTGFAEEAGFTPHGAAWVARKRWPSGEENSGPWSMFALCRRPKHALTSEGEQALIHVWSAAEPVQVAAGDTANDAAGLRTPAAPDTAVAVSPAPPRH